MITTERRQELCSEHVTLNGNPAVIRGWRNEFATVSALNSLENAEWAWETVDRIVREKNGEFKG
jgi:hypothetical protein